jgi:UDP-N-acetylmuramoyl-tripeptide--D-alanyl-D-alanine ligase
LFVADTAGALRASASAYREAVGASIVAVTGSAGKTTVKEMTADMLSAAMPTARTLGNWNNDIGIPLSLLAMERHHRAGVFEIGISHPGEMEPLCELLKPTLAIITNVGPAHLGPFCSIEAIAREKAGLLRHLGKDAIAVLCKEGGCFDLLRSAAASRVITVSMTGDADYVCIARSHSPHGTKATIYEKATGQHEPISLSLPGDHQVINAMMAAAMARQHGVSWDAIRTVLEQFTSLPMRWQRQTLAGVDVINDAYNASPISMSASIKAFADVGGTARKWLVLGGMLELGNAEETEHRVLGRALATGRWEGLITLGALGALIADGAREAGYAPERIIRCKNHDEAGKVLAERVSAGDAVLLKASRGIKLEKTLECWSRHVG